MTDLLERLRRGEPCAVQCRVMNAASGCDCAEAADEIERLRAAIGPLVALADAIRADLHDAAIAAARADGFRRGVEAALAALHPVTKSGENTEFAWGMESGADEQLIVDRAAIRGLVDPRE